MNHNDALNPRSTHTLKVESGAASDAQQEDSPVLDPPRVRHTRHLVWRTERPGILTAEAHGFRLVVLRQSVFDKLTRYMVLRRQVGHGSPLALLTSGMEADVRRAMEMAEEMGCRFAGLDPEEFGLAPPSASATRDQAASP